jgi:primase-polymerase (primpol)-like protein
MSALSHFDELPRWVLWRNEARQDDPGKLAKVPYRPDGRKASSTAPATWVTRAKPRPRPNGQDGGIGIVFGKLDTEEMLAGIDLDTCRHRSLCLLERAAIGARGHRSDSTRRRRSWPQG